MKARNAFILTAWLILLCGGFYYLFINPTEEEKWCRLERPDVPFSDCIKEFGY